MINLFGVGAKKTIIGALVIGVLAVSGWIYFSGKVSVERQGGGRCGGGFGLFWTSVVNSGTYNGRALALGRELAAYVISADLIDLKNFDVALDTSFRAKIRSLLTTPTDR